MMVKLPKGHDYENGALPTAEEVKTMTEFNVGLCEAGIMLSAEGLHPTSKGARVETRNGARVVTDGPFAETKEVLGGFWIIKVGSFEEAKAIAARVPDPNITVELRQIFDLEDFPQDVQDAFEEAHSREPLGTPA